jgi:DNA-binding NarL/FixJ family response regulator
MKTNQTATTDANLLIRIDIKPAFWHNNSNTGGVGLFVIVSGRENFVRVWQTALLGCVPHSLLSCIAPAAGLAATRAPNIPTGTRLIVLDLGATTGDRTPLLRNWKSVAGGVPIILGGSEFSPDREMAALALGMSACCDQRLPASGLGHIINVVLGGGVWVSGLTFPQLMSRLSALATPGGSHGDGGVVTSNVASAATFGSTSGLHANWASLTERQKAVALLIADGENNKIIARKLDIADRTVKAHLSAVFEKLHVTDRTQLAVLLNRHRTSLGQ